MPLNKYRSRLWGSLRTFQVPRAVIVGDQLFISPASLTLYLVLMLALKNQNRSRRNPESPAAVVISQKLLRERSGLSKNIVGNALKELRAKVYISYDSKDRSRRQYGEYAVNDYFICDPRTGDPFIVPAGRGVFYGTGIPYLTIPTCIVMATDARWSLAKMSSSETSLYFALLSLANRYRNKQFSFQEANLRKLTGLSRATFKKALDGVQDRDLIWIISPSEAVLCDPYTGEPFHEETSDPEDNPANYYVTNEIGRATRVNLNWGDPTQIEAVVRSCLPEGSELKHQGNGNLMVLCPFHDDRNPSCSISPAKQVFHCFCCKKSGTLRQFVRQALGLKNGEAIEYIARMRGQELEFHLPDRSAEAIYSYEDENGKLVMQKLRYPGKKFSQRRPAPGGGWIWNLDGIKPLLYKLPALKHACTVCITEGEKDAERVTSLGLVEAGGHQIIATTSGSADSWQDELAEFLHDKRVVILPDSDEAGKNYAKQILASVEERGIQHRVRSLEFAGVKDVGDFLDSHSQEDLAELIGADWVLLPSLMPQPCAAAILEPIEA